jgi:hypothetical protein
MSDKKTPKYISKSDLEKVIPEETLELFKIANWPTQRTSTKIFCARNGEVDFKTLSPSRAEQLFKNMFPYLQRKPKVEAPKKS